jgi:hypothetical protein
MIKAFTGDSCHQAEVERLVQAHKIKTIVETGTYKGDTTREMARIAPRVITIEINPEYWSLSTHLAGLGNVHRLFGNSAEILGEFSELIPSVLKHPVLFYLDAHWEKHSPLLEELEAISCMNIKPVIVIHDFHNPFRPEFGFDTWDIGPYKLDLIKPLLDRIYGALGWDHHYNMEADGLKQGVIYIEPSPVPESAPEPRRPSTDVVYASYKNDLTWLVYSIRLLLKHLRGACRIVVRLNADCEDYIKEWRLPVTYHFVKPWPDSYAYQMYLKATADQYSEADIIMLMDSDHLLLEPVELESLFDQGKPIIRYKHWDEEPKDLGREKWGPPVQRTLGIPLDKDYMCATPFVFWRDSFAKLRERVQEVTGLPFYDAVYSDVPYDYKHFLEHPMRFCDYEALGLFCSKFEPERYALQHVPRGACWPFRNFWSWGDWTPELQAHLDEILS